MPCVSAFRLSLKISYTAIRAMDFLKQNTSAWGISFGYDKKARTGYQLTLRCHMTRPLRQLLAALLRKFSQDKANRGVNAYIDVNGYDM